MHGRLTCTLALVALPLLAPGARLACSRSDEQKLPALAIPAPFKYEFSQRFNPADKLGKSSIERFRLSMGTPTLSFQYSSQPPSILTGRQLQAAPSNYSLSEFLWKRKWGSVSGFRSTGYNARSWSRTAARKITGAGVEAPKSFLGTKLAAYFLRASPAESATDGRSLPLHGGTQLLLGAGKDFKKGVKLRTEFSQSWQPPPGESRKAAPGRGVYARLEVPLLKSDAGITYRLQNSGLTSALVPARGRGRQLVSFDLRRKFRSHQLQYSDQYDVLAGLLTVSLPALSLRQEVLRWTYSPKRLPQLTTAQTRISQQSPGKREAEDSFQLSLNKGLKRLSLGFSLLRGIRADDLNLRNLWERTSIAGDASLEVRKGRRVNLRYEVVDFAVLPSSTVITSETFQMNTRFSFLSDRISLLPSLDYRRQEDSRSKRESSILNFIFSALMKLPRYLPGSDLLMTFSSRTMASVGLPHERTTGFVLQWNFRRL